MANAEFVRADVQVHPFPPAAFDVALSRFGVMFFADPVAAFANVRRALRPGGRLAFVCLDDVRRGDLGAVFAPLAALLPPAATDGTATGEPLSFADPSVIRRVLTDAGFAEVACAARQEPGWWGRDAADAGEFLAGWGPIRQRLEPLDPAAVDRVRRALVDAMRPYEGPGGVRLRTAAWLVTARRPG